MEPILILDPNCLTPYDFKTPEIHGLGGVESSVIKIAEKLSESVPVIVAQHNRKEVVKSKNVTYSPCFSNYLQSPWQAVIVIRNLTVALELRGVLKNVPIWVWLHDLIDIKYSSFFMKSSEQNIGCIVVSEFHKNQFMNACLADPYFSKMPTLEIIYNPIDDHLQPDHTPVNPYKLFFGSSPHKGLEYTLQSFQHIWQRDSRFELFISNPGYYKSERVDIQGVTDLGVLDHKTYIEHIRNSLCMFNLNNVFPETFGIVIGEANAVGTPVLTHPFGATPEVVSSPEQLINTHDLNAVYDRLIEWREIKRPVVSCQKKFRLSNVIERWNAILNL